MKEALKLTSLILFVLTILIPNIFVLYQQSAIEKEFLEWAVRNGRKFQNQYEKAYRFQIFKQNKVKVQEHNKLADQGKYQYYLGLNQFAVTTVAQYRHQYGNFNTQKRKLLPKIATKCNGSISDSPNPPQFLNWTDKYVEPTVRTQGKCAANWAFSAVGAIEGIYAIKQGKFIKLSDQQIIDCSGDYGNEGCGGGYMEQAFWYAIDQGMANQATYPYVGVNQTCRYSQSQKVMKVDRCARVPSGVYQKLLSAVIQQPVSVSVASQKFILYIRGIFDGQCTTDIDRGMLLVGYGKQNQEQYWILKNSFGASWGQKGYIRLKKTAEDGPGMCGIQLAASVPQLLND